MRPATLIGALAPVTGFTVNSLSSTVLSTIRVLPSAVAAIPFRLRPPAENAATGAAKRNSYRAARTAERPDRYLVYVRVIAVGKVVSPVTSDAA